MGTVWNIAVLTVVETCKRVESSLARQSVSSWSQSLDNWSVAWLYFYGMVETLVAMALLDLWVLVWRPDTLLVARRSATAADTFI